MEGDYTRPKERYGQKTLQCEWERKREDRIFESMK